MMHPNFKMRPSCDEILNLENFTSDLNRELIFLKMKSDHIQEEIRKIEFCLNTTEKIKRNRKSFP